MFESRKINVKDTPGENIEITPFDDAVGIAITSTMFLGFKKDLIKSGTVDMSPSETEELIKKLQKALKNVKHYQKRGA
jgi:hypothetical protein